MQNEASDRKLLESMWDANERELIWISAQPDRELHATREQSLEREQDAIELTIARGLQ